MNGSRRVVIATHWIMPDIQSSVLNADSLKADGIEEQKIRPHRTVKAWAAVKRLEAFERSCSNNRRGIRGGQIALELELITHPVTRVIKFAHHRGKFLRRELPIALLQVLTMRTIWDVVRMPSH